MSEQKFYCSDCGSQLVADTVSNSTPNLYCPKCDKTVWDKLERQKKLAREGIIVPTGEINFKATDCKDDYLEITTVDAPTCVNCGKSVGNTWIDDSAHFFCGFKCLIHYYIKELKKEGKI